MTMIDTKTFDDLEYFKEKRSYFSSIHTDALEFVEKLEAKYPDLCGHYPKYERKELWRVEHLEEYRKNFLVNLGFLLKFDKDGFVTDVYHIDYGRITFFNKKALGYLAFPSDIHAKGEMRNIVIRPESDNVEKWFGIDKGFDSLSKGSFPNTFGIIWRKIRRSARKLTRNLRWMPRNIYWWFVHRLVPRHKYHVIYTGLTPGYHDGFDRIVWGSFTILEQHVKIRPDYSDDRIDPKLSTWKRYEEYVNREADYLNKMEVEFANDIDGIYRQEDIDLTKRNLEKYRKILDLYVWWIHYKPDYFDQENLNDWKEKWDKLRELVEIMDFLTD